MRKSETLSDHLEDLRKVLLKCFLFIFIFMGVTFYYHQAIFDWIQPNRQQDVQLLQLKKISNRSENENLFVLPEKARVNASENVDQLEKNLYKISPGGFLIYEEARHTLVFLGPLEGFKAALKISFWSSLGIAFPFCLYFLFQFALPGMHRSEKKAVIPFSALSVIFIGLGIFLCWKCTLPLANQFFSSFNSNIGTDFWGAASYLDYVLILLAAHAIIFELCGGMLFFVHLGLISSGTLKRKRKHFIVTALILSAALTPPDVFTQLILTVPMVGFYELGILYAKIREPFQKKAILYNFQSYSANN